MGTRRYCTALAALAFALGVTASEPPGERMQGAMPGPGASGEQVGEGPELERPDIERWIFLGATVGHGPVEEGVQEKFAAGDHGRILVTHMEPSAYEHFREHGSYADGTTFAVSFYDPHPDPEPAMDGLALGELAVLAVHRLERAEDGWEHGFYMFGNGEDQTRQSPFRDACVACHTSRGDLDGTFVQFYPVLRDQLRLRGPGLRSRPGLEPRRAAGLGPITRAEFRAQLASVFKAWDHSGDGYLAAAELESASESAGD